jgi:hypothetical protein
VIITWAKDIPYRTNVATDVINISTIEEQMCRYADMQMIEST